MVQTFEQSESIGLVSSYDLKGTTVRGSGSPYPTTLLPGKELAQLYLRDGVFVFGSPTTVMYRSSIVRDSQPFYDDSLLHEDTEKCMQIMESWDFGFVHQVLSFLRTRQRIDLCHGPQPSTRGAGSVHHRATLRFRISGGRRG